MTATVNILPLSITVSWFEEAFHVVVRVTFAALTYFRPICQPWLWDKCAGILLLPNARDMTIMCDCNDLWIETNVCFIGPSMTSIAPIGSIMCHNIDAFAAFRYISSRVDAPYLGLSRRNCRKPKRIGTRREFDVHCSASNTPSIGRIDAYIEAWYLFDGIGLSKIMAC